MKCANQWCETCEDADEDFHNKKNEEWKDFLSNDKQDSGKPRYSLLPLQALLETVKVAEFGANKYGEDNYLNVPDAERRYIDAALRHIFFYLNDSHSPDEESGLNPLAHAALSLLFVMEKRFSRDD